jgi:hypothetical protein
MFLDLSDSVARMDADDLTAMADVLPFLMWGSPEGSDVHAQADALIASAIEAQGSPRADQSMRCLRKSVTNFSTSSFVVLSSTLGHVPRPAPVAIAGGCRQVRAGSCQGQFVGQSGSTGRINLHRR